MSPAERFRAAATRLREVAGDATPGPWDHVVGASEDHAWVERRHTETVVTTRDIGTSAYIAMMHPPVALALAEVLDHEADLQGMHNDIYGTGDDLDTLAVAVLGGERS